MKKIIITIISTLAVLIISFLIFIYSGVYDISTASKHNAMTLWVINTLKDNSIERRDKDLKVPNLNDSLLIKEGFEHYAKMCVGCHAAPGVKQGETVKSFYPTPPKIYRFANKLGPKETFWIIKNGIKMTAMPAYGNSHADSVIWGITAFITKKLGNMNADEFSKWYQSLAQKENAGKNDDDD